MGDVGGGCGALGRRRGVVRMGQGLGLGLGLGFGFGLGLLGWSVRPGEGGRLRWEGASETDETFGWW